MTKQVIKAPSSVLDVGIVWTKWLNSGDKIISSTWTTSDVSVTTSDSTHDNNSTRVLVAGGELGKSYSVTNRITTEDGLVDERYILLFIQNQGAI